MQNQLVHIADRVLNRPLLILPEKASVIAGVLSGRIGITAPQASEFEGSWVDPSGRSFREFPARDGVAIISIVGSLVNRGAWIGASSGLVSYEGIQEQVKQVAAAEDIESVILDIESPGGEAIGAFETAVAIRELATQKRVVALVNGMACSAGYALASAAHEIVTTESAISGSIGVVMLHVDFSKFLEAEGVNPTFIFAGKHKVDGNAYEPLPEGVKSDLQKEVDAFYDLFLSCVAAGRGERLNADAARATEARYFMGAEAVSLGLADRIGTFDDVMNELTGSIEPSPSSSNRSSSMAIPAKTGAAAQTFTQEQHDAAIAEARTAGVTEGTATGTAAGAAAGATTAIERVQAALGADGIKGDGARMAAALDLLVKSPGMAAADVTTFVTSNVAPSPKGDDTSRAAYEAGRGLAPSGGLAAPGQANKTEAAATSLRVLENYRALTGAKKTGS